MSSVIKVKNLSKQYRLGKIGTGSLSHDINRWWHSIRGKEDPYLKIGETNDRSIRGNSEYVWSLKDINFEIEQGDAVGIIGRNGAGKSTLLKILSRVTGPTTGSVKVKGRIASLLEVGTGFHPELSGRENIFLNGAILGMRKHEIQKKFDEIVAFSGVERYIDTPVKRYSSGMYVRLAFAVAAHLESEILIVDEVLAVGDAEFQKKCLGKMGEVSKGEGRTILFVSHNMASVKTLCKKGILLKNGELSQQGVVENVVKSYLSNNPKDLINVREFDSSFQTEFFRLKKISVVNSNKSIMDVIDENLPILIATNFELNVIDPENYHITYHLLNDSGEGLFSFSNSGSGITLNAGSNSLKVIFPEKFLQPGIYYLTLMLIKDKKSPVFVERDVISFAVTDGERALGIYMGKEPGYIRPKFNWQNNYDLSN